MTKGIRFRPKRAGRRQYGAGRCVSDCPRRHCRRHHHRHCRSEEHTSELQSLMRISYAVFCLKKKKNTRTHAHESLSTLSSQTMPCDSAVSYSHYRMQATMTDITTI